VCNTWFQRRKFFVDEVIQPFFFALPGDMGWISDKVRFRTPVIEYAPPLTLRNYAHQYSRRHGLEYAPPMMQLRICPLQFIEAAVSDKF